MSTRNVIIFIAGTILLYFTQLIDSHFFKIHRFPDLIPYGKTVVVNEKRTEEYSCQPSGLKKYHGNDKTCYSYYFLYEDNTKRVDVPHSDFLRIKPGEAYLIIEDYNEIFDEYFTVAKLFLYFRMFLFAFLIVFCVYMFSTELGKKD